MEQANSVVQRMNQGFFNRLLHLLESRPQQGRRMIGLSAPALWELWQRIQVLADETEEARRQRPGQKRQAGGGQAKAIPVICRLLVTLLSLRQHWTMQAIGEAIESSESTVWNYIHEMLPYLRSELPAS
jgi:Helix-turn-helix of DDE superfamily endonuclease